MDIYAELRRYIEAQLKVFAMLPLKSDFQAGVIEGLNLIKVYIDKRIEDEGAKIAEALDGHKS